MEKNLSTSTLSMDPLPSRKPRSPEEYFAFFLISSLCAILLLGTMVTSVFLYADINSMRKELRSDMEDFTTTTDQAWSDLLHLRPRSIPEAFLIGIRTKRQYDQAADSTAESSSQNCSESMIMKLVFHFCL